MATSSRTFLPAAGHDWFLPMYDPLTKLLGVDRVRTTLLDQAALQSRHRVLDVGCGTGTLAVLMKRLYPTVDVTGVDPDPKALSRARRKAERAAVSIQFDEGFADTLEYPDATFDRVFSSLMLHHLEGNTKQTSLREIHRVLRPGGRLELADFANAHSGAHGVISRLIHSHRRLRDNSDQAILLLMTAAGFVNAKKVCEQDSMFGHIAFYQASAP